MALSFLNVRTAAETLERMVLSVVSPSHPEAYMGSCYGHVCHSIRGKDLAATDEVVFLGIPEKDGVIHSIILGTDGIITDALGDGNEMSGDVYHSISTRGAKPIEMHVKGRINIEDFKIRCLSLVSESNPSSATQPTSLTQS